MAIDRSPALLQALLIPDSNWAPDAIAAGTSYTGFSPLPGTPQPDESTYAMGLGASGKFADASKTLTITTQQGGNVGRTGASFRWNDGGSDYGWDAPTVLVGWEPVVWSTSNLKTSSNIIVLQSGALLAVWTYGSLARTIYVSIKQPGGSWSTPATITTDSAWSIGAAPCLLQLPSGKVLLFAWVANLSDLTAITRCMQSDDDGVTWALSSSGVLPEPIAVGGATDYTIMRCRVAYSAGQIVYMAWLRSGDTTTDTQDELRQYASSDGGSSFSLVWSSDRTLVGAAQNGGSHIEIISSGGSFYIGYISHITLLPYVARIESGYQAFGDATKVAVAPGSEVWATLSGSGKYATDGEFLLTADETGVLFCSGRLPTDGNVWVAFTSQDIDATWIPMAKSSFASGAGKWWSADSGTYPYDAHSCWYQGQWAILASQQSNPSAYDGGSLSLYLLGGYSSVTMPGYDPQRTDSRQVTWGQTWLPLDLPGDSGWTRTVVGTPTESLSSGLLRDVTTLGESILYSVTPGGTVAGGAIAAWSASVTTGSNRVRIRTADGSSGYQLTIGFTPTTLTVTDQQSGATLATATISGEVNILASITDGVASVWYRSAVTDPTSPRRLWTRLVDSVALGDNGAGWAANLIDWGIPPGVGAASDVSWRSFFWIDDEGADYVGTGLGAVDLPDGLLGRRYASSPVSLDGSTSILATCGPTFAGEKWAIDARYEHGPDSIFPSVSPSPRQALWLDSTVSNSLVFDLHSVAEADGFLGRPLALGILGTNAQTANLYGWSGAAWVLVASWNSTVTGGAGYTRSGRFVTISSGGTVGFAVRNQYAGGSIDLGGGKVRKIAANTEGQIGASSSFSAIFQLDGIDGTEGASGTAYLYSPSTVAIVAQPTIYQKYKLTFPAITTAEGYLIVGQVLLGSVAVLGRRPSNGRQISFVQQAQSSRPPGGPRSWRRLGPSIRRVPLEFGELLPTSQIFATSPTPDYARLSTAGVGNAALHATALSMVGVVEENLGKYVVFVGNISQQTTNTGTTNYTNPGQITYGRITDPGSLNIVRGNESSTEVLTLTGMILEEEP